MNGISHFFARKFLHRKSVENITRHPQLVCFSFDLITQAIHLNGRSEHDQLEFLETSVFPMLPQPGICLDIGANIGNHSVAFARHFKKVLAFEPNPRTFELLNINAMLEPNIQAFKLGASSSAGQITAVQDRLNIGATSIGTRPKAGHDEVSFELIRLDDVPQLADAELPITFIKIDVEGHEHPALVGAEATLRRHRPLIVIEVLPDDVHHGATSAVEFLRSLGYGSFYELREGGWLGKLGRRPRKLARTVLTILTGKRPSKAQTLAKVERLEKRSYPMLLCAIEPLKIR